MLLTLMLLLLDAMPLRVVGRCHAAAFTLMSLFMLIAIAAALIRYVADMPLLRWLHARYFYATRRPPALPQDADDVAAICYSALITRFARFTRADSAICRAMLIFI